MNTKRLFITSMLASTLAIGATAYADFGENNYLQSDDEIYVVAYDNRTESSSFEASESKVILHQKVQ